MKCPLSPITSFALQLQTTSAPTQLAPQSSSLAAAISSGCIISLHTPRQLSQLYMLLNHDWRPAASSPRAMPRAENHRAPAENTTTLPLPPSRQSSQSCLPSLPVQLHHCFPSSQLSTSPSSSTATTAFFGTNRTCLLLTFTFTPTTLSTSGNGDTYHSSKG